MKDGLGKEVFEKAVCGCACAIAEMGEGRIRQFRYKIMYERRIYKLGRNKVASLQ